MSDQEATLDEFINKQEDFPTNGQLEDRLGPVVIQYPSEWNIRSMESLYNEKSIGTNERGSESEQQVPLIKMGDLNIGNLSIDCPEMVENANGLLEKYGLEQGDLLFNTRNTPELVGKTAVWDGRYPAVYDNNLLRVRFKTGVSTRFINYYLSAGAGWRQLKSRVQGTTSVAAIYDSEFDKIEIPLPDTNEQRKIASVLYTVDQAIQKTDQLVEQAERVQTGVIQENILDKISQASSPTELGDVPDNWDKVQLEDVASEEGDSLVDGPFGSSLKAEEFVEDGFARILQLQNVKEGWYSDSNIRFVDQQTYEELERHSAKPGDLFIAKMASPVARACILPDKYDQYMLGCADVVKLTPNDEFVDEFVMYCLNSYPVWKQAAAHIRGSGRLRVNLNQLKEVELPKPPIGEQKQIVNAVNGIMDYIDSHKKEKDRLQRLKQGLMQDLLSGEVRTHDTDIEIVDEVLQHG